VQSLTEVHDAYDVTKQVTRLLQRQQGDDQEDRVCTANLVDLNDHNNDHFTATIHDNLC